MRSLRAAVIAAAFVLLTAAWITRPGLPGRIPEPIWGVTIDDVGPLDEIEEALEGFRTRLTARIVFDPGERAIDYRPAVEAIAGHAWVMGEILDSADMKGYTREAHLARVEEYWRELSDIVNVWEVGNEVNGEWLGDPADVAAKVIEANAYVKARHGRTAVTPFYNADCWDKPGHEMFAWIDKHLPASFRNSVDYVFVSYYEEECGWRRPDWDAVFSRLGSMFPKSRLGFGEVGVRDPRLKPGYLRRYYGMGVKAPRFVGGYFWWYFNADMLPRTRPMWRALREAVR